MTQKPAGSVLATVAHTIGICILRTTSKSVNQQRRNQSTEQDARLLPYTRASRMVQSKPNHIETYLEHPCRVLHDIYRRSHTSNETAEINQLTEQDAISQPWVYAAPNPFPTTSAVWHLSHILSPTSFHLRSMDSRKWLNKTHPANPDATTGQWPALFATNWPKSSTPDL